MTGTARFSEGPMFQSVIALKVRYSEIKVYCSENKVQYSEKNEFTWKIIVFVVFNLRNYSMF